MEIVVLSLVAGLVVFGVIWIAMQEKTHLDQSPEAGEAHSPLVLEPAQASSLPAVASQVRNPSPLADPKWGLAWSNPLASDASLVTNALLKGYFAAILEACLYYGMPYVRAQWEKINRNQVIHPKTREYVSDILDNIEEGFARAAT